MCNETHLLPTQNIYLFTSTLWFLTNMTLQEVRHTLNMDTDADGSPRHVMQSAPRRSWPMLMEDILSLWFRASDNPHSTIPPDILVTSARPDIILVRQTTPWTSQRLRNGQNPSKTTNWCYVQGASSLCCSP